MGSSMQQAGDAAKSVAEQTRDAAGSVVATATEETRALADDAKDHARELLGDATTTARGELDSQAERVSEGLHHLSEQFESMAASSPEPAALPAEIARRVGTGIGQFAERLDGGGIDGIVEDVKHYARQNPMVFLAGAAAAGFVCTRVLRNMNHKKVLGVAKDHATGNEDTSPAPGEVPAGTARPALAQPAGPEPATTDGKVPAFTGSGEFGG